MDPSPPLACAGCGTPRTAALLSCPVCGRLCHSDELKRLASEAERAAAAGDSAAALSSWRAALLLLPQSSRQYAVIRDRLTALSTKVANATDTAKSAQAAPAPAWAKRFGPFGFVVVFFWKFKFLVIAFLSKAKFLLLGLTKLSTLFSMLLSMGAYWALYGWKFAIGFIGSIYVHEMGHVAALRRFGIPASAPMFIPGLGAIVRLTAHPATVVEDAQAGLAGPIWGLGAALFCFLAWKASGIPVLGALAHSGAWLNLFNLIPVWQLDGARGFKALGRNGRLLIAGAFAAAWALSGESLLALLALVAALRAFGPSPSQSDRGTLIRFFVLIAALSWLVSLPIPGRK